MKCPHCGGQIDMQSRGGTARAAALTAERRKEIAKQAAAARWKDKGCGPNIIHHKDPADFWKDKSSTKPNTRQRKTRKSET